MAKCNIKAITKEDLVVAYQIVIPKRESVTITQICTLKGETLVYVHRDNNTHHGWTDINKFLIR